jgi:PAS domain S-box-containing protein
MSFQNFKNKAIERHLYLLANLCIFGGLLFTLWALVINLVTGKSFEIWPIRIGISILLIVTGFIFKKSKKLTIEIAEWVITILGVIAVLYAFYISWIIGLDPTWVTGTTLIIVGILNYLTGTKQAIVFSIISISIGALSLIFQNENQLMQPLSVLFNYITATSLGFFSSLQRNRFLLELIQLETRQNIILSTMSEGVVLHDRNGFIISVNESAPKILGLSLDQILGKSNIDPLWKTFKEDGTICHPEMHPSSLAQSTGVAVKNFILKLQKADGSIVWLSINAVPTFEKKDPTPVATVVTIQDITEKKANEETIRTQEVSLMLAAKLSGLGEMASGIAHEINNPLAIISGRISIVKRELLKDIIEIEVIKKNMLIIEETVARIAKIVNSMKSLSRQVESDNFVSINIEKIIEDVQIVSKERLKHMQIDLQFIYTDNFQFECQPGLIGQAVLNLINNATDAIESFDKKWIRVEFKQENSFVIISVVDCGHGIPTEIRNKILEPFFTTKGIGKGTGLGLSLVQSIVRTHKGELSINSHNINTEFEIKLPLKLNFNNH